MLFHFYEVCAIVLLSYVLYRLSSYLTLWSSSLEDRGRRKLAKLIEIVLLYPFLIFGVLGAITLGLLDHIDVQRVYRLHIEDLRTVRALARLEHSQNETDRRIAAELCGEKYSEDSDVDAWISREYERLGL